MGFSLAGFGACLAESAYERIEEERKFSYAALQGRLERASVLKMQQEKEAQALEKELRERKSELVQLGVEDQELMKAYLFSPVAFEALKKAKMSTDAEIQRLSPKDIITPNTTKIAQMTGTVDDLISNAVRSRTQVEPAKALDTQGRSWLSPSAGQMQRRLEQTASARGMTLEDVARAESGFRPSMPEPVASVNFGVFKKEDKSTNEQRQSILDRQATEAIVKFGEESKEAKEAKAAADSWRKAADTVEPKTPEDADKMIKRLEAAALRAGEQFGENIKEYTDAANRFSAALTRRKNLTPEQDSHAKMMDKAQFILFNPKSNATPEQKAEAKAYVDNYENYKRQQKAKGEPDEKMPSANALISIGRTGGANAVRATYGASSLVQSKQLMFTRNPADGSTSVEYYGNDPDLQKQLARRDQEGIVNALRPYMTPDGRAMNRDVEAALRAHNIDIDENRRPVLIEAPAPAAPRTTPTVPPATPGAGRAGQAKPAAAPPAPAAAATINEARDAIRRGANRDAVIKRLRDMGITPPGDL
jgi:hypothetical protein